MSEAFLQLQNLKTHFPVERGIIFRRRIGTVRAVTPMKLLAIYTVERGKPLVTPVK